MTEQTERPRRNRQPEIMKDSEVIPIIPLSEKYTLSIKEASQYFRISEKKLRQIVNSNPQAKYVSSIINHKQSADSILKIFGLRSFHTYVLPDCI